MLVQTSKHGPLLIVLDKGDKLVEVLTQVVTEHRIPGGCLSGVGALRDVELGYYVLDRKTYLRKIFSDQAYELLTLTGNVSLKQDLPYVHVHAVLGKDDFSTFGGHLFEATVAVTAEITLIPFDKMPVRKPNLSIGLDLICGSTGA